MTAPRLHVPDEPVAAVAAWRARLAEGAPIDQVLLGEGGVSAWYWHRWQSLRSYGLSAQGFDGLVAEHARELALWLRGERTHAAAASSLAGRVARRLLARPPAPRPMPAPSLRTRRPVAVGASCGDSALASEPVAP